MRNWEWEGLLVGKTGFFIFPYSITAKSTENSQELMKWLST